MHYIAVNLVAALLFLIGVSLIYGTAGTLNMADLAARIPEIEPDRRMLMEAGAVYWVLSSSSRLACGRSASGYPPPTAPHLRRWPASSRS